MIVEKLTTNRVKYTFDVTPHEFEHGLDHAFEHVQKDVEVKGFRKGHVPRNIYESKFGVESLYEDALNHVLHHKMHEAQNHPDYEIVGQPKVEINWESVKRDETFQVSLVAPVKPEVTLGQYAGIEVSAIKTEVTDSEVNAEIKTLLTQNSELQPKEGSLNFGDTAIFDFEGFLDGVPFDGGKAENYSLEIGSNQFIPGFEEQMIGMNPGDVKDLNVTFPEKYQAENLAGKAVVFNVKLHEVKTKSEAELNDEFVKTLNREGVTTVEELKASTRKTLEDQKKSESENTITEHIITTVLNNASMDIPQEMVDEEVAQAKENVVNQAKQYGLELDMFLSLSGVNKEQFEAQLQDESLKRVKTTLVVEAIAKKEGFKATAEELVAKYDELAKRYNMSVEDIKKYIPENALENDVVLNKAYQFILDSAVRK
ncbi:MAG: trigger factor [Tenericutes bacterium GWC2_34_14]|nr:MAG: trigger factor [Tenericutes bacterium GWA2_35_7]OHE29445.1 MAG: trigger factor [Tenericutes bacterium GWC2_34_14]OHE34541.1 MAG: trigger factor [Tenericutes bacterium GWE2_34_108]OHE35898.1 MAG: trigger factor [Tenericutes bacterium GWF1_35_14]OHE39016.1 MAG: trigger factor [Tenericutes bacterium GWF2_35_184]OHE42917.1 MAG: trigger factor [Tenericutes bacterium RIFOXYA2_FULL_36_32]OHE46145.1 MAG: trigger factor [Tenericutes bacterium RIFOXYB2_FULL_36_25]OHE47897.1 MAG: trigger factor